MSEPQQPLVPPSAQPNPAFPPAPPAPHLPAAPQYPAAPQQYPAQAPQYSAAPQQYPAAQQYPTAQPTQATPQYPAAARPDRGNTLGRTAFLIAVLTAGLSLVVSLFTPFLYLSTGGFETTRVITELLGVISFLGYVTALVLGLIALKRPGSTLLVGIAIGIAGVSLLGLVVGVVSSTFYNFF